MWSTRPPSRRASPGHAVLLLRRAAFRRGLELLLVLTAWGRPGAAQVKAEGFDVDRLYLSPAGGGWFVMDTLDMHGGLGGAMALTTGYARDSLRVGGANGAPSVAVVSDLGTADFSFAVTYDRFRLYLDLDWILDVAGNDATVGTYQYSAPSTGFPLTPAGVNPDTAPDAFGDARIGFDSRWIGSPGGPFRLGVGAQLFIPSSNTTRSEYVTDGTLRAMLRLLVAGDVGSFGYAGHLGVHIRPLDDAPTPGSPEGSELLFGVAAGPRFGLGKSGSMAIVVGPEIYGETAFRSLLGTSTGVEALLTGRLEETGDDGALLRVKLGGGAGLDPRFGAPAWRGIVGIEISDHLPDRHAAER
jgi:hypothetical protein